MLITLHCGGMPFNGNTIKERSLGGSESAAYYMARELSDRGHRVTLFTNTNKEEVIDGVRYIPCGTITDQFPMGEVFHFYAENTPTDVMIIQRNPRAFAYQWASKINLWWLHDLALYRNKGAVQDMLWNVDGVLVVSEWHKNQVKKVYDLDDRVLHVVPNGVDRSLFQLDNMQERYDLDIPEGQAALLYTSRPERGLENLVGEWGIMEELLTKKRDYTLYVCGYDNTTPQMESYYSMLKERMDKLPNVVQLGALTKSQLADVMMQVTHHVYPSSFEETSCITAMECMSAGLPMIASKVGALPETVEGSGTILIPLEKDGSVNKKVFITRLVEACSNKESLSSRKKKMLKKAEEYGWNRSADRMVQAVEECFSTDLTSNAAKGLGLIRNSDFYASLHTAYSIDSDILKKLNEEIDQCYSFTKEPIWDGHYEKYYEYEKERGVEYGPEDLSNNHRFIHVANIVSGIPDSSTIMDYGCAHGHYTINLAKAFPGKTFVGIDICQSNIDKARKWAEDEELTNVEFFVGRVENGAVTLIGNDIWEGAKEVDCIIAAEVLEHVENPAEHTDVLQKYLKKDGGKMVVTTPFGPWEAQGFKEHWPWRAHVHHFEREDLSDLWGHEKNFNVVSVPSGRSNMGEIMGSYISTWDRYGSIKPAGKIDYDRKMRLQSPRQTLSCCMIVRDSQACIRRCLESVMPYVDEIVIGCDLKGSPETYTIIETYLEEYWPEKPRRIFVMESPLLVGFDEARNRVVGKACGDWIMWIDADEVLHNGRNMMKYLRPNQYNGYAVQQHHFSVEPMGVQKVDLPVRLFRNRQDIHFLGKVHEHPEQELNKGVGQVTVLNDFFIFHDGYTDEQTRRERFKRNFGLLVEDRKENPDRQLGKFLWIRDLAQMSQWELEDTGGKVTKAMVDRSREGLAMWRSLLEEGDVRLAVDSLDYYSVLSRILGKGFEMDVRLDTNNMGEARADSIRPVKAFFSCKEDADKLLHKVFEERTKTYEEKYQ